MKKFAATAMRSSAARFLVAGAINTGSTYLLYLLLLRVLPYGASYSIAFLAGIVIAYVLNRLYVFKAHRGVASVVALPFVYLIQYGVGMLVLWVWVAWAGWDERLAPLAAILLTLPITYGLSRLSFGGRT
jgi:putative flippase GtrA